MNDAYDNAQTDREMTLRRQLRDEIVEELRLVEQHRPPVLVQAIVNEVIEALEASNPYIDTPAEVIGRTMEDLNDDITMGFSEVIGRAEIALDVSTRA